jgi:hypothetical protein
MQSFPLVPSLPIIHLNCKACVVDAVAQPNIEASFKDEQVLKIRAVFVRPVFSEYSY